MIIIKLSHHFTFSLFHFSSFSQKLFIKTIICHHQIHSHKSCVCNWLTINSNNPAWFPFSRQTRDMSSFQVTKTFFPKKFTPISFLIITYLASSKNLFIFRKRIQNQIIYVKSDAERLSMTFLNYYHHDHYRIISLFTLFQIIFITFYASKKTYHTHNKYSFLSKNSSEPCNSSTEETTSWLNSFKPPHLTNSLASFLFSFKIHQYFHHRHNHHHHSYDITIWSEDYYWWSFSLFSSSLLVRNKISYSCEETLIAGQRWDDVMTRTDQLFFYVHFNSLFLNICLFFMVVVLVVIKMITIIVTFTLPTNFSHKILCILRLSHSLNLNNIIFQIWPYLPYQDATSLFASLPLYNDQQPSWWSCREGNQVNIHAYILLCLFHHGSSI